MFLDQIGLKLSDSHSLSCEQALSWRMWLKESREGEARQEAGDGEGFPLTLESVKKSISVLAILLLIPTKMGVEGIDLCRVLSTKQGQGGGC